MLWIENLMKIENPIVMYTTSELAPKIHAMRGTLPLVIQTQPFESIYMWETYKDEWKKELEKDPENGYHSPMLYAIWANKCVWVHEISKMNPFNTEFFMWVDSGGFRIDNDHHYYCKLFPKFCRFPKDKMVFSLIWKFYEEDYRRTNSIIGDFTKVGDDYKDRIVGGFWGGNRLACEKWRKAYEMMLLRYFVKGLFAGKEQNIMASVLLEDPTLGEILEPTLPNTKWGDPSHWLFLPRYLSDPKIEKRVYNLY